MSESSPTVPEVPKPAPKKTAPKAAVKSSPEKVAKKHFLFLATAAVLVCILLGAVLNSYITSNSNQKEVTEVKNDLQVCEASLKSAKEAKVTSAPVVPTAVQNVDLAPVIAKIEDNCGPKPVNVAKARTTPNKKVSGQKQPKKDVSVDNNSVASVSSSSSSSSSAAVSVVNDGRCTVTLNNRLMKEFAPNATSTCAKDRATYVTKFMAECNGKGGSVQADFVCGQKLN